MYALTGGFLWRFVPSRHQAPHWKPIKIHDKIYGKFTVIRVKITNECLRRTQMFVNLFVNLFVNYFVGAITFLKETLGGNLMW